MTVCITVQAHAKMKCICQVSRNIFYETGMRECINPIFFLARGRLFEAHLKRWISQKYQTTLCIDQTTK